MGGKTCSLLICMLRYLGCKCSLRISVCLPTALLCKQGLSACWHTGNGQKAFHPSLWGILQCRSTYWERKAPNPGLGNGSGCKVCRYQTGRKVGEITQSSQSLQQEVSGMCLTPGKHQNTSLSASSPFEEHLVWNWAQKMHLPLQFTPHWLRLKREEMKMIN